MRAANRSRWALFHFVSRCMVTPVVNQNIYNIIDFVVPDSRL
jgi:hypothetical protein